MIHRGTSQSLNFVQNGDVSLPILALIFPNKQVIHLLVCNMSVTQSFCPVYNEPSLEITFKLPKMSVVRSLQLLVTH